MSDNAILHDRQAASPIAEELHVLCASGDPTLTTEARELLRTLLPTARCEAAPALGASSAAAMAAVGNADCVVVDEQVGGAPGLDAARALRAGGYEGAIVLLTVGGDDLLRLRAASLGARCVARAELARDLAEAIADEMARGGRAGKLTLAQQEVRRLQTLIAAGEVALRLQHSLNNPLAALLAEAQLLEMEEALDPEHKMAVQRLVELCRRMIAIVRKLDGVGQKPKS
jgi:DNA-binding NarL/FixJ family response regulator